jgi:hypothetical protein
MRTERPFFRLARARLVFAVRDNLAHEYAPADGPSGGGGSGSANSWRQDFHPGFLPALDEAATSLVLETRELRWERQPFPTGKEDPVRVDPLGWTIEIPLSLRHRVSDVGVAE